LVLFLLFIIILKNQKKMNFKDPKVVVIGLGYVGLPLAIEFSKKYHVIGYDINDNRINKLYNGTDETGEVNIDDLKLVLKTKLTFNKGLYLTSNVIDIENSDIFIVTVPTPIDESKKPDLKPLKMASELIGKVLKDGNIVIYESTTYPGCTEEDCVPILEKFSGLKYNKNFYCGYSPERINPGDKINTLTKIKKVTSGSTPEVANYVDEFYKSIIKAGTFKASSIKVAEASKAIENAQRDVNVSFVNELALIFDKLNIDTNEVLEAAGTKWNFIKYKPGLVGGHCISVDPYYLAYKAELMGYHPAVILSGRRVNDGMSSFVANKFIKLLIKKGLPIKDAKILILGITFKENCPDIRNTRVVEIRQELLEFGCDVDILDPWVDKYEVKNEYGFDIMQNVAINFSIYTGIILAVSHNEFKNLPITTNTSTVIFDLKGILHKDIVDARL
jgi:UDP-N-acetyl-D-galactosamine dehydrogenase